MTRLEEAFIQCLKDGVYPSPSNINERYRADKARFNRLNGQKTKERLALMYEFGIPYMRGPRFYTMSHGGVEEPVTLKGEIPEYPYLTEDAGFTYAYPPTQGWRKPEILEEGTEWHLKLK